jgi:hypothetical protein
MNLKEKIQKDLIDALKQRNETKTSVLKMILASVLNKEIELKKKDEGLPEETIQKVIKSEAKKRRESIEAYTKAGRQELAQKEKNELLVIESYLPQELPDEEIERIAKETVDELRAGPQDFGQAMKEVMAKTKGQADGKKVSEIVKQLLKA